VIYEGKSISKLQMDIKLKTNKSTDFYEFYAAGFQGLVK
jgi:hypothetical protein